MPSAEVNLHVAGGLVSVPYVAMTRRVMESFGAELAATADYSEIRVSNSARYAGGSYAIEPDASAASYFFAAAAITGGTRDGRRPVAAKSAGRRRVLRLPGADGRQGALRRRFDHGRGRPLAGVDVDMNAISDTVQTLAVAALFAEGPTRIRNVAHIRHKETDRIAAVACELRKLGAAVEEFDDGLTDSPGRASRGGDRHLQRPPHGDELRAGGAQGAGVVIRDPGCTAKTYPEFFAGSRPTGAVAIVTEAAEETCLKRVLATLRKTSG